MSRLIGIPKKLRDVFVRRQSGKPVTLAAERFIEVFREHGVEAAQIPRLLPEVKLDDLQSSDRLLGILAPDLIDKVAKLFGVRSQWLEGYDERIYDYLATYKEPQRLLNHFRTLWNMPYWKETVGTPLRLLTTKQHLNYRDDQREELAPILVEPIAEIGDETIYRYHIYQDGFSWDHPPALNSRLLAEQSIGRFTIPSPCIKLARRTWKPCSMASEYPGAFCKAAC